MRGQAGVSIFVEKPISVRPVEEVERLAAALKDVQQQNGVTVAVGYMLRYHPAVEVGRLSVSLTRFSPALKGSNPEQWPFCDLL